MLIDIKQSDGTQRTDLGCRGPFLCVIAAGTVGLLCAFYILVLHSTLEYARVQRQIDSSIRNLRPSRPEKVNQAVWECSRGWLVTAYCNICFSPEHTTIEEMYRLRTDVRKELESEIELDTLKRIWARLAQTGPHGKKYIARYEASFRNCFSSGNPISVVLPASDKPQ
jgi:hypothetical protein